MPPKARLTDRAQERIRSMEEQRPLASVFWVGHAVLDRWDGEDFVSRERYHGRRLLVRLPVSPAGRYVGLSFLLVHGWDAHEEA